MSNLLKEWEEQLKLLETLSHTFVLSVTLRAPWQPFSTEKVSVEKLQEYFDKGYVFVSRHPAITMTHDYQTQQIAEELVPIF